MDIAHILDQKSCKNVIIYYFSGTGNARNVAMWLTQVAKENAIKSQVYNIAQIDLFIVEPPDHDALLVFVSPIHGFNYPPVMLSFIRHFPKGNNRVVLMNTRAGMLIGNWITPGLTGIAFYLSGIILKFKGYSIQAIKPVDMPSNWISLHPGLNARTVRFLQEKNKERVRAFANRIFAGKASFKALIEVYDILLAPIALGYYFVGRFFLAKTFYASSDCDNCDICLKGCPVKAIIKVDNRPFWTFNCESCMKCIGNCPKKAIETGHGYVVAFSLFFSLIFLGAFYKYFELYFYPIEGSVLKMVVESIFFISLMAIWYRIVHWSMRFKIVERIIVFSSFTKYKWWGRRYKALKPDSTL
jgi:Pyruvate/2-oxoacid:ferredoxin oxidoreductase delta subunit/flavodoxin